MSEQNTSNNNTPNSTPPRLHPSSTASSPSRGLPVSRPTFTPPSNNTNGGQQRTTSSSSSSTPKLPTHSSRYTPPVPSRMSGSYTNNGGIFSSHGGNSMSSYGASRLGSHSASSSPPGTPPNGLRNYYLNAAMHRSQGHHLYPGGSPHGSPHGSSTNLVTPQHHQRPSISITVPSNSNTTVPSVSLARRSYSADQLTIDEPEITVTTPGGSNSTEEHVMNLQRALSNLIEKELREESSRRSSIREEDEEEGEGEGPIMMRGSSAGDTAKGKTHKGEGKSTSASETVSAAHTGGISVTPRVLAHRLDPEAVPSSMTHGVIGSDVTLGGLDVSEKEKKLKEKKKSNNRISRLFQRDPTDRTMVTDQVYQMGPTGPMARAPVLPSKGGVLSNLLKLQGNNRQHKVRVSENRTGLHHGNSQKNRGSWKARDPKHRQRNLLETLFFFIILLLRHVLK